MELHQPEPTLDLVSEALRQAGLLGNSRGLASERMTAGKASAVYKVRLSTGQVVVLKLAPARVVETEALWLQRWRAIGVDTPEVYAHGVLTDATPYLLMQFVDGPSVQSAVAAGRLPYGDAMRRTGRILATMHSLPGTGFGSATWDHLDAAGNGCFPTLREQLATEALPCGLSFALEVGAISESDLAVVERAVDLLSEHVLATGSRLTHGDFRTGNMLHSAGRFVVIDPAPALTHPYICLAYTLLLEELEAGILPLDFLTGYQEVSPVDVQALDAALLIRAGIMFNSFGRRRETFYGKQLPNIFARLREQFTKEGVSP